MIRRIGAVMILVAAATVAPTSSASATSSAFGIGPLSALDTAANAATTAGHCGITTHRNKVIAMVLAPSWPEVLSVRDWEWAHRMPSPLTLSRWDTSSIFRPADTAYKNAWWHPGVGYAQMDDLANDIGREKFEGTRYARAIVIYFVKQLCANNGQVSRYMWRPWGACHKNGVIGQRCLELFNKIYNKDTHALNITRLSMSVNGGASSRACSVPTRPFYYFPCVYVNHTRAEGDRAFTAKPDGTTNTSPLSHPFYIYNLRDHSTGHWYELRTWLPQDTGYSRPVSGRRQFKTLQRTKGSIKFVYTGVCVRMWDPYDGYYPSCP